MATQNGRRSREGGRRHRARGQPPLYAAVDLGTNNCRLLIAQPHGRTFRVVDSYSQIARLGEGLNATGRLSETSIDRAFSALGKIRDKLKAKGVPHVRCIATEACRRAENGRDFIERVKKEIGLSFKIIGPKEEARLALIACHDLVESNAPHVLVLDVGGGSTELSLVETARIPAKARIGDLVKATPMTAWGSLPLGVVTLFEAFPGSNEVEAFERMRDHARAVFQSWRSCDVARETLSQPGAHIIGTSGTVTCLAGVHLKLDRYRRDAVDGVWMNRTETSDAVKLLCELGPVGRAKLPTIGEERANLMLSGCAILEAAMDVFPVERLRVADRGLREGLLLSMMYGPKKKRRRGRKGKLSAAGPSSERLTTDGG